jgi:inner membrane protein
MDNLTHTLFAATLANTRLRTAGPGATAALVLASNAPDVDVVTAFTAGGAGYLAMHRGPTHGPLGILALAVATAALVRLFRSDAHLGKLLGVSLAGVVLHVAMDLPTIYGTRLLSPFTDTWFAVDWLPIIDIYLLMALAIGVIAARWRPSVRGKAASVTLAAVIANYVLHAAAHELAMRRAAGRAVACPGAVLERWKPLRTLEAPRGCVAISALPGFVSPFRWRIVERGQDEYRLYDIDLMAGSATPEVRLPAERNDAVVAATATPEARGFLAFARLPLARSQAAPDGATLVQLADVRFMGSPLRLELTRAPEPRRPFAVTIRMSAD